MTVQRAGLKRFANSLGVTASDRCRFRDGQA